MLPYARPLHGSSPFPLDRGLVLDLPFDDRSGARAYDRSGKGNHGTLSGCTWVAGRRGSALSFNGVAAGLHLKLDIFSQATFMNGATLEALIRPSSFTAVEEIIITLEGRIRLRIDPVNTIACFEQYDGAWKQATDSHTLVASQVYHLIGTWDTATNRFYANAVLGGTTVPSGIGLIDAVSRISTVGINYSTTSEGFPGTIFRVCVWNRALTAAEVKRRCELSLPFMR